MRPSYPKSFRTFLLIAFGVVVVPIVVALVHSAISINELSAQSRNLVYLAAQTSQIGRGMVEVVTALERAARQYEVLEDPALFGAYTRHHSRFVELSEQFAALPMRPPQREQLNDAVAREQRIFDRLQQVEDSNLHAGQQRINVLAPILDQFGDFTASVRQVRAMGNEIIDQEVGAFRHFAERAQRLVLWQLVATGVLAVVLVAGFTLLLNRPVREIDRAIRQLGDGNFNESVRISGPLDLEALGERLDWLRKRLVSLEAQRGQVLRHVSHELKTPLTALREGSDLLAEEVAGPLNPRQQEVVRIVRVNSLKLQRLIEELLSYNQADYRKSALSLAPVDLNELVRRVLNDQRLACEAKQLDVQASCGEITLLADADKLRVIVDNLLSNAVKYSPVGGAVRIGALASEGKVLIEVADQGPGIPEAERERVFDPFFKGRVKASGPVQGTGLGLAIVRDLVAAHRGTIAVGSGTNAGAYFSVLLPQDPSSADSL